LRDNLGKLDLGHAGPHEIAVGTPPRYFDVGDVALGYGGRNVGRLILLREITHRKDTEFRLQAAHAELERQLEANLALQQQLREQAIRDGLTGLHNRRFFDEVGPVLLADAERTRSPLVMAMIDIDLFKRLNDTHGHQAGDAVLRMVGAFLRKSVRQGDMVFRLGGEEFLILLPHATGEDALRRLDEWRALFAGQVIEHGGTSLTATFSIGLALYPDNGRCIGDLLQRADQALYQAKAQGRNRAVRWTVKEGERAPVG
jgi:diguanylate cyclase (GGDEF)-like protein